MEREERTDTDDRLADSRRFRGRPHEPDPRDSRLLADGGDERRLSERDHGAENRSDESHAESTGPGRRAPEYADGPPKGEETGAEGLTDLLSDPHTRYVLQYLNETDKDAVELPRVADHVAAKVTSSSPEAVPDRVSGRVETWIHSGLIPELTDHGVVSYDPDTNRLGPTEDVDE